MDVLKGFKALVIDDLADNCDLARFILEDQEMEVACANSVKEALQIFPSFKPDILIADINMPVEDGYFFIRQIRKLSPEEGGQVPAIALTAYTVKDSELKAIEAGYQKFISKPFEINVLIAVVKELLL